jgi:chromate reductase
MVSGSLRQESTNTALLRSAARLAHGGIEAVLYTGLAGLPQFNPDDDPDGGTAPPQVRALRAELADSDAILFCTPEYAGGLPGSFKNLLDWSVGGGETYGMPVAWINAAGPAAPNGGADAHAALRKALRYTGSRIVESACTRIPISRGDVGADGLILDPGVRDRLGGVLTELARAVSAPPPEPEVTPGPVYVMVARIPQDGVDSFQRYEQLILPLLIEHEGSLERMRSSDRRTEVHILRFLAAERFAGYRNDPRRAAHRELLRESGAQIELYELHDVR